MQPTSTAKNHKELQHMYIPYRFMSAVGVAVLYQSQLIQQETSDHVERDYDNSLETDIADESQEH